MWGANLANIVCLANFVNYSPRGVLFARDDGNHVPRFVVPLDHRRLVTSTVFHLSSPVDKYADVVEIRCTHCLNIKPKLVSGSPSA